MGEIINLNRTRKARDKAEAKARAAANRVIHGRSKAERREGDMERKRLEQRLDDARRED